MVKEIYHNEKDIKTMVNKIINKYHNDIMFRHIFWITIVYILSQWFLLVVSGIWWDDWVYVNKNWDFLYETRLKYSAPLSAYTTAALWILPDGAYRWLVFLYFYVGSVLVYIILNKIDIFSVNDAFWITLLYVAMPINDARITWICCGYSLGLLVFWIAFYLTTLWQGKHGRKMIYLRILSLLVLVFSFQTESNMPMTLIILLYLYYEALKNEWNWKEFKNNIKNFLWVIVRYIDFLLAPIVYYIGKVLIFPGYTEVGSHSYVDWQAIPKLLAHTPCYIYATMLTLLISYGKMVLKWIVRIILLIAVLGYAIVSYIQWNKSRKAEEKSDNRKNSTNYGKAFIMICVGMFAFFVGFFTYVVKAGTAIETTGASGRYALLIGIGTALIFYYAIIVIFSRPMRKLIYILLALLGIFHFNFMYLDWQENYYQQLCFEKEVAQNKDILKNDTFLCLFLGDYATVYYQLNGNSYAATGEENRLYIEGINGLTMLKDCNKNKQALKAYAYCMRDWDCSPDNLYIDGIILFRNTRITNRDLLTLKYKELFNREEFDFYISNMRDFTFIPVTKSESDALVEASKKGELSKQNIQEYVDAFPDI